MKEMIGKTASLVISRGGKDLFFTGVISSVSNTHITFKDKFNKVLSFNIENVVEVHEVNSNG